MVIGTIYLSCPSHRDQTSRKVLLQQLLFSISVSKAHGHFLCFFLYCKLVAVTFSLVYHNAKIINDLNLFTA